MCAVKDKTRIITKDAIKAMALTRGVELSDQRAEELVPEFTKLTEGVDFLRDMLQNDATEPALVFHVPGKVQYVG